MAAGSGQVWRAGGLDRDALTTWVATRVAVAVSVLASLWMLGFSGSSTSWLGAWDRWDTGLYVKIARFGYDGYPADYPDQGVVAFFPGEPMVLRLVHLFVRDWVASGLLVSAVAGAVACVALARLGALEAGREAGSRAVLYLVLSPYAVFLAAAYSEALFLALALPAWLAAQRGRWLLAGVLAAGASTVRVTGVFLALALVVQWFVEPVGRRKARDILPLTLPFVAVAAYLVYVHHLTGDWLGWQHAQRDHWGRKFTAPWSALHTTWDAAAGSTLGPAYQWSFGVEIVAVAIGLVVTVLLVLRRRWPEVVYVGGQVAALATSAYYLSVARATLLWWPLWIMLAGASTRYRWVHPAYLAVAPALMLAAAVAFTQGRWIG
jgi:hypothetical protein